MKAKFIQASLNKCRKMRTKVIHSAEEQCGSWCHWGFGQSPSSAQTKAEKFIPKDVPKGHVVVYIGQDQVRYVVKINLLNHPLFRSLLDQARDKYDDSTTPPKLWIPCDEAVFLHVLRCAW